MKPLKDIPVELDIRDSLHAILARSPSPDDEWLWCIWCGRFFQARYLRIDYLGNLQGCAFCECAGFDCAIFPWDTFKQDPDWPVSKADLHHGLCLAPAKGSPL